MTPLSLHMAGGAVGLVSGAIALAVFKGGRLHRRSGMIFVVAMLVMASTGAVIAAINKNRGNVMGGTLACYLVTTGLFTVRRRASHAGGWLQDR